MFDVDKWQYGVNKKYTTQFTENKKNRIPVVSGITINNGVNYYTEDILLNDEIFESELTISTRGEYSGSVFFHSNKFALANNVLVMKMSNLTKNQKMFIGSLINTLGYGGYSGYPRKETLKTDKIQLPIKNNHIDFEFMENFIAELEAERVAELEAYLSVSGLKDYKLTDEEERVLNDFENIEWGIFNLKELFGNATRGKRLKSEDRILGKLPFVTAGETDDGISDFINNNVNIFSKNTITIDMFGSAKYRNYEYGADDHIAVVHTEKLSKFSTIFIRTSVHKSSYTDKFSYSRNFYAKDADELDIKLPTKNSKPDYSTMETFISAIQKLVIKDVVLYSEKKLNTTKKVVNT